MHMFNAVKDINQVNKHSTIKGMNISTGDITRPMCLKMAPFVGGNHWVNMTDLFLNLN